MPSHKIHLAIVQRINEKLKLNSDEIMLGSVLPDLTTNHDHGVSHFQSIDIYPQNLSNPNSFVRKYSDKLSNPVSIGYLIHLLTDRYYNYRFYEKFYDFKDNKPNNLKINYNYITNEKKFKDELFNSYDEYILKNKLVAPFQNYDVIKSIPKYEDITFDKDYLIEYMDKTNKEIENTKIDKTYTIDEQEFLDNVFDKCEEYVMGYLKNNHII